MGARRSSGRPGAARLRPAGQLAALLGDLARRLNAIARVLLQAAPDQTRAKSAGRPVRMLVTGGGVSRRIADANSNDEVPANGRWPLAIW